MQHRSISKMTSLSIVTLGIYQLFWLYDTKKELTSRGGNIPSMKVLLAPVVVGFALAVLQVITHLILTGTTNIGDSSSASTAGNIVSIIIGIIAILAIIPIWLIWFFKYCRAAEIVTNKQITYGMSYALLLVFGFIGISFIWPLFMQYMFNKTSAAPTPMNEPLYTTPVVPGI